MQAELVKAATSEKLAEIDWTKNIEISELVARDQRKAKDVVKAIKKRLSNKNPNTQLFAVMLLEMLMNNIGNHIHEQVVDAEIIPILVKIVKKKVIFSRNYLILSVLNIDFSLLTLGFFFFACSQICLSENEYFSY